MSTASRTLVDAFRDHAGALWITAVLFFVVGDLATTSIGLSADHVREVGPAVRFTVERYGFASVVLLKAGTLLVCAGVWRVVPSPYDAGVPFGLTALGVAVTGWNATVLASVG